MEWIKGFLMGTSTGLALYWLIFVLPLRIKGHLREWRTAREAARETHPGE